MNPVGVVEVPEGWVSRPRRVPGPLRAVAGFLLVAFFGVTTVTSAISLGRYCLTSHASDARPLQPR